MTTKANLATLLPSFTPLRPTVLGTVLLGALLAAPAAAQSTVTLLSESTGGGSAVGESINAMISPCGRFVAYASDAPDITAETDTNGTDDVFLYDVLLGTTALVTKAAGGGAANGASIIAFDSNLTVFSEDGRFLVIVSQATDLTADTNDGYDVFLYDRITDEISLITRSVDGGTADAETFSVGSISADGRYVVYNSFASDITNDLDDNGADDVFLYDRVSDSNTLISTTPGGGTGNNYSEFPLISRDGSTVAFTSRATDLTTDSGISGREAYLWDRATSTTTLISRSAPGFGSNANSRPEAISATGRFVVVESSSTELTPDTDNNGFANDLFYYDAQADSMTLITTGVGGGTADDDSRLPVISDDGRIVAFHSEATDLTVDSNNNGGGSDGTDVYMYDADTGVVTLLSRAVGGGTGDGQSKDPAISADGRFIAFESRSTDLTADPHLTGGGSNVYLYDRATGALQLVSRAQDGSGSGDDFSTDPRLSRMGRYLVFDSEATDLTLDATNDGGEEDVFLFDLLGPDVVGSPFCAGDGSGDVCPCGNAGAPGEGCANSTGGGARLSAGGSASVSANDLSLQAEGLPPGTIALLFAGDERESGGVVFGDGLRCAGGSAVRLGARVAFGGTAAWSPNAGPGGWAAGEERAFQVWYRNPAGPCGALFNLSNGVAVCFAP